MYFDGGGNAVQGDETSKKIQGTTILVGKSDEHYSTLTERSGKILAERNGKM